MDTSNRLVVFILWYSVFLNSRQTHGFQNKKSTIHHHTQAPQKRRKVIIAPKATSSTLEEDSSLDFILNQERTTADYEEWDLDLIGKETEDINVEKTQSTVHDEDFLAKLTATTSHSLLQNQIEENSEENEEIQGFDDSMNDDYLDSPRESSLSQLEILTKQVQRQQQQIERLFKELETKKDDSETSSVSQSALSVPPRKAMLFIDGTWLYYSLYGREPNLCPIRKKYGHNWARQYNIDWSALPRIICEALDDMGWSSLPQARYAEVVRVMVFTSYKADTLTSSLRYQLFEQMREASYDVNQMETVGKSEKCVDIQLAVELLHYATIPDAYDIAVVLTGDKDFLPALSRTRQKGRKIALVSMRSGCNQALREAEGIKDYDVIWLEDHLEKLLVRKENAIEKDPISLFTISKVINDFIDHSGGDVVNSRDVGRYLQCLSVGKESILDHVRSTFGGLNMYIAEAHSNGFFTSEDRDPRNPGNGFLIRLLPSAKEKLLECARQTTFSKDEKTFFKSYKTDMLSDKLSAYYFTLSDRGELTRRNESLASGEKTIVISVDYSKYTVNQLREMCRELDLPTSGVKSTLIERIAEAETTKSTDERSSFWQHRTPHQSFEIHSVSDEAESYLKSLVDEYLSAAGGTASSRDLGRYLAANKSSSGNRSLNTSALKELKSGYITISRFIDQYPDLYSKDEEGGETDHEFLVSLRKS